jgi:hypothetical protein
MRSLVFHPALLDSSSHFIHTLTEVKMTWGMVLAHFLLSVSFISFRALLQPCIHDGILAPTTEQRLRYADWLYVWAKDRTSIPSRMASLVDEYHVRFGFWFCSERRKHYLTLCRGR